MRKYLITGVLALAAGGFLTSCHDDDLSYTSIAEAKQAQFAENFEKFFGEVSPNQDWGFGDSSNSRTRGCNSDANNWDYSKYDNIPEVLTEAQKDKVRRWFQQHEKPQGISLDFSDFFVQQVYKGGTKVTSDSQTSEHYTAGNGDDIVGGNQMDWLCAGYVKTQYNEGYDHIENFNGANYSGGAASKEIWDGKTYEDGYPLDEVTGAGKDWVAENKNHRVLHNDMISLMEGSNTKSFGYHSSQGSVYYHNKFVIIPGDVIQGWDSSTSVTIDGEQQNSDVSKMWFVGFDYEGDTRENAFFDPNQESKFLIKPNSADDPNAEEIHNGNGLKAVIGGRDYYYSDWIVRITPGHKRDIPQPSIGGNTGSETTTTNVYKKKFVKFHKWVFCEDLGNSYSKADFDYNDLVFDVKIIDEYRVILDENGNESEYTGNNPHSYYALVTPLAAGGELLIKFQPCEKYIHGMFDPAIADNVLVNTVKEGAEIAAPSDYADKSQTYRYELSDPTTLPDISVINNDIIILVTAKYNQGDRAVWELQSYKGKAPHKLCVTPGTQWPYERTSIDLAYTGFQAYVGGGAEPWNTGVAENLYPLPEFGEKFILDQTDEVLEYELDEENSSSETTYTVTLNTNETELWKDLTGNHVYNDSWQGDYVNIAKEAFNNASAGSIIRFYGIAKTESATVNANSGDWKTSDADINNTGWQYNSTRYEIGANYKELVLNETTLAKFQANGMYAYGKDLILLCISIENLNSNTNQEEQQQTTFTAPTLAQDQTSIFTNNDGVALTSTGVSVNSGLSTTGENSEITVYGIGESDANVSVTTSDGTALSTVSSARTRAAEQKSFKFKVQSEAVAAKIRSNGIKITGSKFKMYMIAAKIVAKQNTETPTGEQQIWPATGTSSNNTELLLDSNLFTNVVEGSVVRFYGTHEPNDCGVQLFDRQWGSGLGVTTTVEHWDNPNTGNSSYGYVDITLTAEGAAEAALRGIKAQFRSFTCNIVTIIVTPE